MRNRTTVWVILQLLLLGLLPWKAVSGQQDPQPNSSQGNNMSSKADGKANQPSNFGQSFFLQKLREGNIGALFDYNRLGYPMTTQSPDVGVGQHRLPKIFGLFNQSPGGQRLGQLDGFQAHRRQGHVFINRMRGGLGTRGSHLQQRFREVQTNNMHMPSRGMDGHSMFSESSGRDMPIISQSQGLTSRNTAVQNDILQKTSQGVSSRHQIPQNPGQMPVAQNEATMSTQTSPGVGVNMNNNVAEAVRNTVRPPSTAVQQRPLMTGHPQSFSAFGHHHQGGDMRADGMHGIRQAGTGETPTELHRGAGSSQVHPQTGRGMSGVQPEEDTPQNTRQETQVIVKTASVSENPVPQNPNQSGNQAEREYILQHVGNILANQLEPIDGALIAKNITTDPKFIKTAHGGFSFQDLSVGPSTGSLDSQQGTGQRQASGAANGMMTTQTQTRVIVRPISHAGLAPMSNFENGNVRTGNSGHQSRERAPTSPKGQGSNENTKKFDPAEFPPDFHVFVEAPPPLVTQSPVGQGPNDLPLSEINSNLKQITRNNGGHPGNILGMFSTSGQFDNMQNIQNQVGPETGFINTNMREGLALAPQVSPGIQTTAESGTRMHGGGQESGMQIVPHIRDQFQVRMSNELHSQTGQFELQHVGDLSQSGSVQVPTPSVKVITMPQGPSPASVLEGPLTGQQSQAEIGQGQGQPMGGPAGIGRPEEGSLQMPVHGISMVGVVQRPIVTNMNDISNEQTSTGRAQMGSANMDAQSQGQVNGAIESQGEKQMSNNINTAVPVAMQIENEFRQQNSGMMSNQRDVAGMVHAMGNGNVEIGMANNPRVQHMGQMAMIRSQMPETIHMPKMDSAADTAQMPNSVDMKISEQMHQFNQMRGVSSENLKQQSFPNMPARNSGNNPDIGGSGGIAKMSANNPPSLDMRSGVVYINGKRIVHVTDTSGQGDQVLTTAKLDSVRRMETKAGQTIVQRKVDGTPQTNIGPNQKNVDTESVTENQLDCKK